MTIITGQQANKSSEEKPPLDKVPVAESTPNAIPDGSFTWIPPQVGTPATTAFYPVFHRRRLLTTICATLLIMWLLLAACIGGLLLFRYFNRRSYHGICATDLLFNDGRSSHNERLSQNVEINSFDNYEKIEVPEFGANHPAMFVHDFKQNLTAIVDRKGHQCFIKPLDRTRISPPKSFLDLLQKMEDGYYEQTSNVIKEQYTARVPSLNEMEMERLGSWIIDMQCRSMNTYMLERNGPEPMHIGSLESEELDKDRLVPKRKRRAIGDKVGEFVQFLPLKGLYQYDIRFEKPIKSE